ncbi:hypothetical protein HY3_09405 [Hyphomonas pacifica]|uniref:Flagellar L-ring protein n=2 Tax=Hyphomonas pacifica TaxID=1280941 RepID=A0A062U1Q5_9PROT|nr:hypothetical protein HY2_09275 [Hyphomonas pacifica]RAN35051.1 hypothetical protein HY3_09405 [Hyphomonas pacifica]
MKQCICLSVAVLGLVACASAPAEKVMMAPPPPAYYPVAMDMDTEPAGQNNPSLWTTAPNALLSMRRAKEVGDLLTVVVEMDDRASMQTSLSRNRDTSGKLSVDALFGLPEWANGVLPGGASLSPGVDYGRSSSLGGSGAMNRAEKIAFTLAARVVALEPNGNLVIQGYQQTRVSNEVRVLTVSGVIRAQDITRTNTVTYDKIADAQLSYLNSGDATSAAQPKAGQKILDRVVPF